MSTDVSNIHVDIVSDVVCPWCAIGYYQLRAASRATNIPVDVHWHPFELKPQMAPEGENLREVLAQVLASGRHVGIELERMPVDIHRYAGFARRGLQLVVADGAPRADDI